MTGESTPRRGQDLAWLPSGGRRGYIRFVALGDSATCGLGDADQDGSWRGWARLLAAAIAQDHDVSFCNLAVAGSTIADVRRVQLEDAVDHGAHVASLIVGLNDTVRSTWDRTALRADLLHCAQRLSEQGALLLTVRFHDHARVFRLPGPLGRRLRARIDVLNQIYDEIHERYGGLRVDLAAQPGVYDRDFWSFDRLHPSELGHRALAHEFTSLLHDAGLRFEPPGIELDGTVTSTWRDLRWTMSEVVPWLGRRTRDLAPAMARSLVQAGRERLSDQLAGTTSASRLWVSTFGDAQAELGRSGRGTGPA
jgi:lysophospholipase L1-like esterase